MTDECDSVPVECSADANMVFVCVTSSDGESLILTTRDNAALRGHLADLFVVNAY